MFRVLASDPRKNALLKAGNKSDRIDARKLSELLYLNKLSPVYHGEHGIRALKELARSYITITRDLTRVMSRLKAIYRGWGIACAGQQVYAPRYRAEWLAKISEGGVRRRAELYYQQFDALAALRQGTRRELLAEARKHPVMRLLRQIPSIGPIRAALLIALLQTPNRFRTKRQLWAYCGLALRTYTSGDYRICLGVTSSSGPSPAERSKVLKAPSALAKRTPRTRFQAAYFVIAVENLKEHRLSRSPRPRAAYGCSIWHRR
jgi:transposase